MGNDSPRHEPQKWWRLAPGAGAALGHLVWDAQSGITVDRFVYLGISFREELNFVKLSEV